MLMPSIVWVCVMKMAKVLRRIMKRLFIGTPKQLMAEMKMLNLKWPKDTIMVAVFHRITKKPLNGIPKQQSKDTLMLNLI